MGLRQGDRRSSEAALKFFLSSVTATAVSLMGISFVYASTGTLYLTQVAERIQHVDGQLTTLVQTGVVLTLVGFAFKAAAVPFHFWVPDTYVGAPLPIAAYLSVIGKAVGFSGLILVTVIALPSYADVWGPALAALAALTMTVGNVGPSASRPRARTARYACSPGRPSVRRAISSSRSPPPRTPTTPSVPSAPPSPTPSCTPR